MDDPQNKKRNKNGIKIKIYVYEFVGCVIILLYENFSKQNKKMQCQLKVAV